MIRKSIKVSFLLVFLLVLMSFGAYAQEPSQGIAESDSIVLRVMSSGGFYSALEELTPIYERQTGKKIILISGSSMGSSPTAIPARLKRGEDADIVVLAGPELDKLINEGLVVQGSRVDLVLSKIGMVVRTGAPKPDISTTESFIRTLLEAKSIGYSASASGTYLSKELFPRLGIWPQIQDKSKMIVKDRVASWVARGDLEIGFQQVSELLSIPGVDFVGTLPEDIQKVTVFSAGTAASCKQVGEVEKLIHFLTSSEARPIIIKQGLEPAN